MKGAIEGYGVVDFDPATYDNNHYDLYCIRVCSGEQVVGEERYTSERSYESAIRNTYGRELVSECTEDDWCDVACGREHYDCECTYHYAFVTDKEEDMNENLFQMYELEALLGDFIGDFDVDGIIADATEVRDGKRYWTVFGDELNVVLAKHEK